MKVLAEKEDLLTRLENHEQMEKKYRGLLLDHNIEIPEDDDRSVTSIWYVYTSTFSLELYGSKLETLYFKFILYTKVYYQELSRPKIFVSPIK